MKRARNNRQKREERWRNSLWLRVCFMWPFLLYFMFVYHSFPYNISTMFSNYSAPQWNDYNNNAVSSENPSNARLTFSLPNELCEVCHSKTISKLKYFPCLRVRFLQCIRAYIVNTSYINRNYSKIIILVCYLYVFTSIFEKRVYHIHLLQCLERLNLNDLT